MKYSIKSRKSGNIIEVEYDDRGILVGIQFQTRIDPNATEWVLRQIPTQESAITSWQAKTFEVSLILETVTFEMFWEQYHPKVGKIQAEKQWSKLSMADRAKAIKAVPRYIVWCRCQNPPRRTKDPERYLSNQTFNDEFKID